MENMLQACFDADFYLTKYPDIKKSGMDPLKHFIDHGHEEARIPHAGLICLQGALKARAKLSPTPLTDILSLFPTPRLPDLLKPAIWERLRSVIQPPVYFAQTSNPDHQNVEAVFDHYLSEGVFSKFRVNILFNPAWYLEELDRLQLDARNRQKDDTTGRPIRAPVARLEDGVEPFFHWLTEGWNANIVPTPLFDADFYLHSHGDLKNWSKWLFLHYLYHGCYEHLRRPCPYIDRFPAANPDAKKMLRPLVLDLIRGENGDARWPYIQQIDVQAFEARHDLRFSSALEDVAARLTMKTRRLDSGAYMGLVAKAAAIEPLIHRPYGARMVNAPPFKYARADLFRRAEALRKDIGVVHTDIIILAPHCRMAGSARVTGALTHALRTLYADRSVLLLTTDLPDFEHPEWFNDGIRVFDFSAYAEGATLDTKTRLLLDVVRGLTPTTVINVNSRLGWDLLAIFGKVLAAFTNLYSYLFTWELDIHGNKVGYPVIFFQSCFDALDSVFLDSTVLRDELIDRYALSTSLQKKLHVLHTPTEMTTIDHSENIIRRRADNRKMRAIWAGRFDRQKRFDVVVGIAKRMPELEIWAWGKQVLGGANVDFDALPPNIKLQGTYQNFDDLPIESCDFFLYTSEWDGLPTVLIDAGARAIPTVASCAGGTPDIINDETAYPVLDKLNPDAYVQAIKDMTGNPHEACRRARAFKKHVEHVCNGDAYIRNLHAALALTEQETTMKADASRFRVAHRNC